MQRCYKIVVTGPECSGKSTISAILANYFDWPLVEEYAREYFITNSTNYELQDIEEIARIQYNNELRADESSKKGVICDSNLLNLIVWAEIKFGECPLSLKRMFDSDTTDLYLLCKPDFSYQLDPLREDIDLQNMLFDYYLSFLLAYNLPFSILAGSKMKRKSSALLTIDGLDS